MSLRSTEVVVRMASEVYRTEREYEAMSIEELTEAYNDLDLRRILQRVFNLDSDVYFIDKAQKLIYISDPDRRPEVLAAAAERRSVHRDLNRENRSRPDGGIKERMEEETRDRQYRLLRIERRSDSITDDFTGKAIRSVYIITDVVDGVTFNVSRGTCRWLEERGRIEGFEVSRGRRSVAHDAGLQSVSDLFAEDTKVSAPAEEKPKRGKAKAEVAVAAEEEVSGGLSDDELDALLDSLPS